MKKYTFIAVAFAALAAVSCVKDNMGGAEGVVYDATFSDAVDAKATITVGAEQSLVSWETTDRVGIMYGDSNVEYKADQAGASTMLSPVSASADASEVWAVLPYDASATLAGGVISTTVPAEQPALEGGAFHHLAVAYSTNGTLAFKNVCGLVRVRVTTEGITKVVFAGKASEKVAGDVAITVAAEPAVSTGTSETVALVPASGAASIPTGDYFLAVLPQNFASGFTVKAYKGETAVVTKDVAGQVELKRCGVFAGTIREVTISAISTDFATVGETITVTGTGFSTTPADNVVTIGGKATEVTSASATELKVTVPKGLSRNNDYSVDVTVKGASKVSSPKFRYWYLYTYKGGAWVGKWGNRDKDLIGGTGEDASIGRPFFIGIDPNDANKMWVVSNGVSNSGVCWVDITTAQTMVAYNGSDMNGKYPFGGDFEPSTKTIIHIPYKGITEKKDGEDVYSAPNAVLRYEYGRSDKKDVQTYSGMGAMNNPVDLCFTKIGDLVTKTAANRDDMSLITTLGGLHTVSVGIKPASLAVDAAQEYIYIGTSGGFAIYRVSIADLSDKNKTTLTPELIAGTGQTWTDNNNSGNGQAKSATIGDVPGIYYDKSVNYIYFLDMKSKSFKAIIPGLGGDWTKATVKTVLEASVIVGTDVTGGKLVKDSNGNFYQAINSSGKILKLTQE